DNVLPSRFRTFRTDANSLSRTRSRFSLISESVSSTQRKDALFDDVFGLEVFGRSRTAQIRPSPLDKPDMMCSCAHSGSIFSNTRRIWPQEVPFRAFELSPTMLAKRFV